MIAILCEGIFDEIDEVIVGRFYYKNGGVELGGGREEDGGELLCCLIGFGGEKGIIVGILFEAF